jgi:hypothetical protein
VKHRASVKFWFYYRRLPDEVRELADRCFEFLRSDPRHPSLQLKRIGRYVSVRVGLHYRALAVEDGADLVWFWIGPHGEYDVLLRGG